MRVENFKSNRGNKVSNQFVINNVVMTIENETIEGTLFQSYDSNICFLSGMKVYLDKYYWNYSKTTSKYRNQFLNETTKEIQKKINSGEYKLVNLN